MLNLNPYDPGIADERRLRRDVERRRRARERFAASAEPPAAQQPTQPAPERAHRRILFRPRRA